MKTYRALKAFPHGNSFVDNGALVRLTDKQATFLEAGGFVEPHDDVPDAPAVQDEAATPETSKTGSGKAPAKTAGEGK